MISCIIPQSKIAKIEIYVNTDKLSMATIKKKLGCQYIINGGLYNMSSFQPVNYLTVNNKIYSKVANPYGFAIKENKMIFFLWK